MVDKVRPLKLENSSLGGTENNLFPTDTDPTEDYLACKGVAFENNDSYLLDVPGGILHFNSNPVILQYLNPQNTLLWTDYDGIINFGSPSGAIFMYDPGQFDITADYITDSHISSAAAITRSKLASGTANRVVINNASGVMTDSSNITYTDAGALTVAGASGSIITSKTSAGGVLEVRYDNSTSNRFTVTSNDGNVRLFAQKNANSSDTSTFDFNALSGTAGASAMRFNRDVNTSAAVNINFYKGNNTTSTSHVWACNTASGNNVINNQAEAISTIIKASGDATMFVIDGTNARVGIGGSPSQVFHQARGNHLHEFSSSGATISHTISNTSNTASSKVNQILKVAGTSADDPFITFTVTSGSPANWSLGTDNSDSDKFKISQAATLGTSDAITIDSSNFVGINISSADSQLHVHKATAGSFTAHASSIATFENSGNGYITVATPTASESGILFANLASTAAGGIIYNNASTDNGLQFRGGDSNTTMAALTTTGLGLGINNPSYRLHLIGSAYVGLDHYSTESFTVLDQTFSGGEMFKINSQGSQGFEGLGDILIDPAAIGYRFGFGNDDPQEAYHQSVGNWLFGHTSTNQISMRFFNSSNTTNASVRFELSVAGTSANDPFHLYTVTGATSFSVGIDNSDSDKYKISRSTALGTSDCLTIDSTGKVTFPYGVVSTTYTQITHDTSGIGPSLGTNGQIACGSATGGDSMYFQANGSRYFINASGSY